MLDNYYDKLAQEGTEITTETSFGKTFDLYYKLDKDEEQLLSKLRSEGNAQRKVRNNKVHDLIFSMSDKEKEKYTYHIDPYTRKVISESSNATKRNNMMFFDYNKISIDNGLITNEELDSIDINNSMALRKLMEQDAKEGGGKLAAFAGSIVSQANPLNAPENYIPFFGWAKKGLTVLSKAGKIAKESMAIQTALEPQIHEWKDKINSPYAVQDSVANVGLAGLFGGGLSLGLSGIEHILKNVKLNKKEKKVFQDAYDTVKESPFRDEVVEPITDLKVVDNSIPETMKPTEHDIDLRVAKEIEEFQAKVNSLKEPEVPHTPEVKKITAKERVDAIEKDFADELKQNKEIDGKQLDLPVEKSADESSDFGIEFKKNIDAFVIKNKKGIMIDERLIKEKSDKFNTIVVKKSYRVKEKGKWKSSKTIGDFIKENQKGEYILATKEHALFYKNGDIHGTLHNPKDEMYSSYYIKDISRKGKSILAPKDKKAVLAELEDAKKSYIAPKKEKAWVSKGVDKKVSKIDKLTFTERKNRAKIEKLETISDGKPVSLSRILDEADIEIETYKGLKDCIL